MKLLALLLLLAAPAAAPTATSSSVGYRLVLTDGQELRLQAAPKWVFGKAFVRLRDGRSRELRWQEVDHERTKALNPRSAGQKPAAKTTWTEEDLARLRGQRLNMVGGPEPAEAAEPGRPTELVVAEAPKRSEGYWRSRATPLRENIAALEARIKALDRARDQWESFALGTGGDYDSAAAQELGRIRRARQAAESELSTARSNWSRLEEDARKSGALPGWLR